MTSDADGTIASAPALGRVRSVKECRRYFGAERLSLSAIRVCQPGPVDRQRRMTSSVRRIEISFFGFKARGRPPLLTDPRSSISSVNSGSSSYSCGWMMCAATLLKSDPKEWRDARLFSVIGFPHAEDVTVHATGCVADDHHSVAKHAEANDSLLAVVFAQVFGFERRSREDEESIREVDASVPQRFCPLGRIVGQTQAVSVVTTTKRCNRSSTVRHMKGSLFAAYPGIVPGSRVPRSTLRMSVWPQNAMVTSSSLAMISSAAVTPASPRAPSP